MRNLIFVLITSTLLAGCATQVPVKKLTPSGKAEGDYPGKTVEQVSSAFVRFCNNGGLTVYESTTSSVVCGTQRKGTSGVMTQVLLGNAYSTPPMDKVRFSISKNETGVHAWADLWVETQMPGGQLQQLASTNNEDRNSIQTLMDNIKVY